MNIKKKNNRIQATLIMGITTLVSLSTMNANASGDHVGNGGVVFICNGKIQLVDAWEAEDTGYPLKLGKTPDDSLESQATTYLDRLTFFEPGRADNYRKMYKIIAKDLKLLAVNPHSTQTTLVKFTDGELPLSLDSDNITKPRNCERKVQAVTQKNPLGYGERLLTIDPILWANMTNETRVLTIFHEINVFYWIKSHEYAPGEIKGRWNNIPVYATTEPARLLNRFIGSPTITSTKSVCDYFQAIKSYQMFSFKLVAGKWGNGGYGHAFLYGGLAIDELAEYQHLECWESTRRLKSITFDREDWHLTIEFFNVTAPISNPYQEQELFRFVLNDIHFRETSDQWSGKVFYSSLHEGVFIQDSDLTLRASSETTASGGSGMPYRLLNLDRVKTDNDQHVPMKADIEISNLFDVEAKETIHP